MNLLEPHARPMVDIVIVNWNTGDYVRQCVTSIFQSSQEEFALGTVVVVDNASTDASVERLREIGGGVELIANSVNRGFGAACNEGAAGCHGELLLFLNPDTTLSPTSLDEAVAFMKRPENGRVGICGVRMMEADGTEGLSCSRFPTPWMWLGKMVGLGALLPRVVRDQRMAPEELVADGVVDQVIGAFFLIRRSLFDELGGFDERFFMYLEEVDLSLRARKLGYVSYFLGSTQVFHQSRVSSSQVPGRRLFYLLRSRVEFARKHWPHWQASLLAGSILVLELPGRALVAAAARQGREVSAVAEAGRRFTAYLANHERVDTA